MTIDTASSIEGFSSKPSYSIQSQKVSFTLNLDDGSVKGAVKFTIKPQTSTLTKIYLNARGLEITSINFGEAPNLALPSEPFKYETVGQSIEELAIHEPELINSETTADSLKYCNLWHRRYTAANGRRELEIPVPANAIVPIEGEEAKDVTTLMASSDSTTAATSILQFHPIHLNIEYSISSPVNSGAISLYRGRDDAFIQLMGHCGIDGLGRKLMPCLDFPGERVANWDLEYSVISGSWIGAFERIHLISSGVLCRQFVNEEKSVKVFHYKIQDIPTAANQIAFIVGIFDAVKVPAVPFAYAFSPLGRLPKLTACMEFLGKAFNFYNWYLNSHGGGPLRSLSSLSSEVFPFPSYYVVFVKDLPVPFITATNLTIINLNLLPDPTQIDQNLETRRLLCQALAEQYFTLRIDFKSPQDTWILKGIVGYLSELQLKTFHGNNDYRLHIKRDIEQLVQLENRENLHVPPLATLAGYLQDQAGGCSKLTPSDRSRLQEILLLKSRLVFVLLERKIEAGFLQKLLAHIYAETLINRNRDGFSAHLFIKLIKRLTGKDLKSFTDQWIFNSGCPIFNLTFLHNRKRSTIEFEVARGRQGGSFKFSGNLMVKVMESESLIHDHVIHLDESTSKFEIPFHSKAKKPRKRKTPAANASSSDHATATNNSNEFDSQDDFDDLNDEGNGGVGACLASQSQKKPPKPTITIMADDEEGLNETLVSPIAWIRIDPEMEWLASFNLQQPDIMWIEALENDRDVLAQWEAVKALPQVSGLSESVAFALERFINDWKAFWIVRVEAVNSLALIGASLDPSFPSSIKLLGARKLIELFNKKFGHPNPSLQALPKSNSFDVLPNYFLQVAIPQALTSTIKQAFSGSGFGGAMDFGALEPFVAAFADLLKYNDNSANAYSDGDYLASIIRAGTGALSLIQSDHRAALRLSSQFANFVSQLERYARLERLLPSPRNVIMAAILEAWATLHASQIPDKQCLLRSENHVDVRLQAFKLFSLDSERALGIELLHQTANDSSNELRYRFAHDSVLVELLQRGLQEDAEELRKWLKGPFTSDPDFFQCVLRAMVALEGSLDLESAMASDAASGSNLAKPLRITLNIQQLHQQPSSQPQPSVSASSASLDNDDDDIWLRELTGGEGGIKRKASHNGALASTSSMLFEEASGLASSSLNQDDDKKKLLKVWQTIWSNYDSVPFRYPVDPSVPGYYAVIKIPMDLSTARSRLSDLQTFLLNLRQIFQNCFTFNQPDSLIYEQAKRLRNFAISELKATFPKDKKLIKKILKTAQEDFSVLESIGRAVADGPNASGPTAARIEGIEDDDTFDNAKKAPKLALKLALQTNSGTASTGLAPVEKQKLKNILQKLCKHRHAYFFLEPVDPVALNLPTYFGIVKEPMDFSTIKDRLQNDAYSNPGRFADNVRLVFSNCKAFNSPGTLVYQVAVELEKTFETEWLRFSSPSSPKKSSAIATAATSADTTHPKIKLSLNLAGPRQDE